MPNLKPYTSSLLGAGPNSFMEIFQRTWKTHLGRLPRRYQEARQLVIGARFRPLLVAWGYLLSGGSFEKRSRMQIAELAVYIELLHKATLLVDDLIDDDSARHGEKTFHVEYSGHEAILFAVYLLGDSLERLSSHLKKTSPQGEYSETVELLSLAIKSMSYGGAREVFSPGDRLASVSEARELIELQTIALIKNGLLTGYKSGHGDPEYDCAIESLGYDCGYLFQALNDLEPFLDEKGNTRHKGAGNIDTSRSRKNIITAFVIEGLCTQDAERFRRMSAKDDARLPSQLTRWFFGNKTLDLVVRNLNLVSKNLDRNISRLPISSQRRTGFRSFIKHVVTKAIERAGGRRHYEKLSEILIR